MKNAELKSILIANFDQFFTDRNGNQSKLSICDFAAMANVTLNDVQLMMIDMHKEGLINITDWAQKNISYKNSKNGGIAQQIAEMTGIFAPFAAMA